MCPNMISAPRLVSLTIKTRRPLVPGSTLHSIPPAVICTAKQNNQILPRVETCDSHRSHHCLCAAHVERDFVLERDLLKHAHVLGCQRVQRPEHTAQILNLLPSLRHEFLVHIVSTDIDTVRAGSIHQCIAVAVNQGHSLSLCHDCARIERLV